MTDEPIPSVAGEAEDRSPMYDAKVINVMIASPGDVSSERRIAVAVVHEWNATHAETHRAVLQPVGWETHASPDMGARGQAIINRQSLDACDLLVAIFWSRLGTPTGTAESGTVEELRAHVAAGRPAMVLTLARTRPR
jgi:hypothetical protein